MPKIKKILYASDLTKNSAYAFKFAEDMAEQNGASLDIVHVIEQMPESAKSMLSFALTEDEMEKFNKRDVEAKEKIKERLTIFCDTPRKDGAKRSCQITSVEVVTGYPASEILKMAKVKGSDVIVIGSHGKGIISHTFLGNVAEKVLRGSNIPVFFIPVHEGEMDLKVPDI